MKIAEGKYTEKWRKEKNECGKKYKLGSYIRTKSAC
jgi:hypothetical protein